ncbi:MAG: hypothetical protein ACRD3N_00865 [Terracidiphilus sp.]
MGDTKASALWFDLFARSACMRSTEAARRAGKYTAASPHMVGRIALYNRRSAGWSGEQGQGGKLADETDG